MHYIIGFILIGFYANINYTKTSNSAYSIYYLILGLIIGWDDGNLCVVSPDDFKDYCNNNKSFLEIFEKFNSVWKKNCVIIGGKKKKNKKSK